VKKNVTLDVSIIVVNQNTKELLRKCLDSIYKSTNNIAFEVIVVDNDSSDGSVTMVKNEFPRVKTITNKENVGFARGNNIGIRKSRGKFVVVLNPDTVVLSNAINNLIDFMNKQSGNIMVGGKILNSDGSSQCSCWRFPTFSSKYLEQALFLIKYIKNPISEKMKINTSGKGQIQEVDWVSGCFFGTRRNTILDLGLFDESIFMYNEDVDLCLRLRRLGGKCLYYPGSTIKHFREEPRSERHYARRATVEGHKSTIYYFKKHKGRMYAYLFHLTVKITWLLDFTVLLILSTITFFKVPKMTEKMKLLGFLLIYA